MGDGKAELENLAKFDQEEEIVIELGADRVLHFLGVYIMLGLAAVAKLSEMTASDLSCHPKNNKTGFDASFISFANTYCWESPDTSPVLESPVCNMKSYEGGKLLSNPDVIKAIIQWIPYWLLVQGISYALPSAWWHFRVGARLMGHLKFMKLFIGELYDRLKEVPAGFFVGVPYDEHSAFLDGWCAKEFHDSASSEGSEVSQQRQESKTAEERKTEDAERERFLYDDVRGKTKIFETKQKEKSKDDSTDLTNTATDPSSHTKSSTSDNLPKDKPSPSPDSKSKHDSTEVTSKSTDLASHGHTSKSGHQSEDKAQSSLSVNSESEKSEDDEGSIGFWTKICLGYMLDRHLFSMLCYENFSSLEHHPYLLSLFRITRRIEYKLSEGIMPLNEGILHQWCHSKNFSGHFLMWAYFVKYVLSILISIAFLIVGSILLAPFTKSPDVGSFRCEVIFHEHICMICTMHRKTVSLALLTVNLMVNVSYLILTIIQWIFIVHSHIRTTAYFFEDLRCTNSVAMWAELRNKQEKSDKKKAEKDQMRKKEDKN